MEKITKQQIHILEPAFRSYFEQLLKLSGLQDEMDELAKWADVYLFSGVIRNFFTGNVYEDRDIDIVVSVKDRGQNLNSLRSLLRHSSKIRKNSFGGLKIFTKHTTNIRAIDLWELSATKYIQDNGLSATITALLASPFFNFSAIVYDYNNRKFHFTDRFVEFCNTNTMEVANSENPNNPLCIVNSIYYSLKYGFKIGESLKQWIIVHYSMLYDYEEVQRKHFGEVHYDNETIWKIIQSINNTES